MIKKYIVLTGLLYSLCMNPSHAGDYFVVKKINIVGLQRISTDTVYNYLPVHVGETLDAQKTGEIVSSLYKTGFFDHISLAREGNTLIIEVSERPTIGVLKISGNSSIPTDKLTSVMHSVDVAEGRAYNSAVLERIRQSLLNQYYSVGRYNARVDISVSPMSRNRVKIYITISEGLIAKVRHINIIGNKAFTEDELQKQLALSTPGLFTFFTEKDRFSQEKLDSSLENLRNFYMDRGYLKFAVKSSQVSITPDHKSIYLTIAVDEGERYTVKGIDIKGETVLPRDEVLKLIKVQPGSTFSRKEVVDSEKAISDALGEKGYIFAVVSLEPKVDEKTKQVFLTFVVRPEKRMYVRHITFSDNSKTNDEVLRREMEQMEAAPISSVKLEQSKHRLSLLPYIKDVQTSVDPVADDPNKVDVNYKVTEENAAQATFSIGYSQLSHIQLGLGFNQKNFLGTGKTLGMNITRDRYQQFLGINYTNPYYTPDGVSRSINLSASKMNPSAANVSRSYNIDQYRASILYSIPLGQDLSVPDRLQLGYGYENSLIHLTHDVSNQVQDFVNRHGRHFQQLDLILGFSRDRRDKALFPTKGTIQSVGLNLDLPLNNTALNYYTLSYNGKWFHPIVGHFIATARADFGYGDSFNGGPTSFPFFKNFYAGGIESVRGFTGNTLGPQDGVGRAGRPTGGNLLADASIGLIFPNHISDNLRTTVFLDGGNVYNTFNNKRYGGSGSGSPRYSTGVEADWLTALGMIEVSVAEPLNAQPGDDREFFQFTLGANFG